MTDRELAEAVGQVVALERRARLHHQAAEGDGERQEALTTLRIAGSLRRTLEGWISARACRAALQ